MPLRSLRLLTALLAVVLVPGLARADGGDQATVQVVDGYTLSLALPSGRVQTGPNDVTITIHTADGAPVSDAAVTVAVVAYTAVGGHADSHGEEPANNQASAHSDDHSAASTDSHGDTHAADGQGHEAIPTQLERTAEPGVYYGILHFEQAGDATVTVAFSIADQERAALFTVPVVQARPRALILGGFALINGLAIVTAAALKRRMPQKQRKDAPRPPVIALSPVPVAVEEERPR